MSELKPCPFCGGRAHLVVREDDGGYRATIYCTSGAEIGCFTKMSHWALKKSWVTKSATEAWNRRAQPENKPLTLDELRGMENEPVWIEHITMQKYSHWYIWSNAPVDDTHDGFDGYGKTWLAYRRKPEGSENE